MKKFLMLAALVAVMTAPAMAKDVKAEAKAEGKKIEAKYDAKKEEMKAKHGKHQHKGHKMDKNNVNAKQAAPVAKARMPFNS